MKKVFRISFLGLSIVTIATLLSVSCKEGGKKEDENAAKAEFVSEKNMVDTMRLRPVDFNKEIISNGKLRAVNKSDLKFPLAGEISKVHVANGASVSRGAPIAELNRELMEFKEQQAVESLEKAKLELADVVLGYGMGGDTNKIPKEMLKVAKIRSGYSAALTNMRQIEWEKRNSTLYAPFAGKIANLSIKAYDKIGGETFCTLIDDSSFEVDFSVLESEIALIKLGQQVKISSFQNPDSFFKGTITQVNPIVDDKGQIKISAKVNNSSGKLIEGMNVKVTIETLIKSQLAVPKSAVVIRDNYFVVFRYNSNGKAMWTYVTIDMSNSSQHVISAHKDKNAELNIGDIIITSGNLNLADESIVEIKKI